MIEAAIIGDLFVRPAVLERILRKHLAPLAGAGLETFAVEPPPPDWPLLRLPNVTLTPHIAGCSQESVSVAAEMVSADIARWYAGQPPAHCANPEVLPQ